MAQLELAVGCGSSVSSGLGLGCGTLPLRTAQGCLLVVSTASYSDFTL